VITRTTSPLQDSTDPLALPIPKLDPTEEHYFVSAPTQGKKLFLRYMPACPSYKGRRKVVLYIHGGTFPSACSIAHRFDGRSWRDELVDGGFDVWGLDFQGFGFSDNYSEMDQSAEDKAALGIAGLASEQLETAVRFICEHHGVIKISIIAHSWGTIAVGLLAGQRPDLFDRLVFLAPIAWRSKQSEAITYPAWRLVSVNDQWSRFTQDVPPGEPAVLDLGAFTEWGERFLDSDGESRTRSPAAVKTPSGPWQDIAWAWAGQLGYNPAAVLSPVEIIHGEWDKASTDDDARWLFNALRNSPMKREVKISRATHLMHLEEARFELYRETETFLNGNDMPSKAQFDKN
jgi:pimeloyl-ACP methyl ester carboxylesterase